MTLTIRQIHMKLKNEDKTFTLTYSMSIEFKICKKSMALFFVFLKIAILVLVYNMEDFIESKWDCLLVLETMENDKILMKFCKHYKVQK